MSFTATNDLSSYKVLAIGHPAESKTNSVTTEQDYTSIYTIPANYLTENKTIRVTLGYQFTTGVSTATATSYVEVGGVKVITSLASNYANSTTATIAVQFTIQGTTTPGASVDVETHMVGTYNNTSGVNTITQPVALATNGTLTIVPGVQYDITGSTETMTLRTFLVEALN